MIGTPGNRRFNCRQPDTAARSCGPGITVTAIAVIGRLLAIEMIAPAGSGTTLPSTMLYSNSPSSIDPSASSDIGSGFFGDGVLHGLKRTITAPSNSP